MKRAILIICLLLNYLLGFSQSLVTSNKAWSNMKIEYHTWDTTATEHIKFTTDTILDGVTYKKVERSVDPNKVVWSSYGYIREDSVKRVFYKYEASDPEQLFYNFNVQPLDTFTAYNITTMEDGIWVTPQWYVVISTDSILIGETFRKRINLGVFDTATIWEQWIDSTGNVGGILHNEDFLVGRDMYQLLCFSEDHVVKYLNPNFDSCYVVTGLKPLKVVELDVSISPNPIISQSTLTITGPETHTVMNIEIYDLTGRKVYSNSFKTELLLRRDDFLPGFYIYYIVSSDGQTFTGKIMVI